MYTTGKQLGQKRLMQKLDRVGWQECDRETEYKEEIAPLTPDIENNPHCFMIFYVDPEVGLHGPFQDLPMNKAI